MTEQQQNQKQFAIQKLYIKDASFESPSTPESFNFKQWNPTIDVNLTNNHREVSEGMYEAVLIITATLTQDEKTAFLVEVQQAGLFTIEGFDEAEKRYLIGSQCMTILFPYLREAISDLSVRGGFPPLLLSPVNFDALYQQHLQKQRQGEAGPDENGSPADAAEAAPDEADAEATN